MHKSALVLTDLPVLGQGIAALFALLNLFLIIQYDFYDTFLLFYGKQYGAEDAL